MPEPYSYLATTRQTWLKLLERIAAGDLRAPKFLEFAIMLYKEALLMDYPDDELERLRQLAKAHDELEDAFRKSADKLPELNRAGALKMLREIPTT